MKDQYPNAVMRICAEIVVMISDASKPSAVCNLADLHERIIGRFDTVIKLCRIGSLSGDAALELLYPLAALADETFLGIPQYRLYWSERLLQLRYFGEADAGTKFFLKLKILMSSSSPDADVLGLYFISLALGMKGIYGVGGRDARYRVRIFEELGVMLRGIRRKGRGARAASLAVDRREKRIWALIRPVIYLCAVSLVMIAVAVFHFIAGSGLSRFLDDF